jgi:hypothetical protein
MASIGTSTLGYSTEDIMKVLQRAYDETNENRSRALKLYDHMENAMLINKGDLVILSQMADRYLEQATRQTELLVRLVAVMQKLKQFSGQPASGINSDVNSLLEILDNNKITPFTQIKVRTPKIIDTGVKPILDNTPLTGDPLPQNPTTISKTGENNIQLEAEL